MAGALAAAIGNRRAALGDDSDDDDDDDWDDLHASPRDLPAISPRSPRRSARGDAGWGCGCGGEKG
eukprot:CAMPEP_0118823804 /NCGR_PEP_ID=MMETSP1162-20130426/10159_1 /TAXON_ID=33656 /ORGANISM="Phaeocystis Sp, Strain CCMP2710" /LENGTH=65 /DNA_ID=CAMNT_0006754419 /DNA_START=1 /DNA_END=196 /DNA_ORIENTATION=-